MDLRASLIIAALIAVLLSAFSAEHLARRALPLPPAAAQISSSE